MLDSLPARPLTDDEAERLRASDPRFVPLSVLKGTEDPYVIYTLAVYQQAAGRVHLLGYSDAENGWRRIASRPQDEWSVEWQEDTVQDWIDEQYGDEFKQGIVDESTGTVDVGQ